MIEPIRIDMSNEDENFGEAFMQALLTGRPLVMFDSAHPQAGEVGMGLDLAAAEGEASDGH